jgi:hypothetical protein
MSKYIFLISTLFTILSSRVCAQKNKANYFQQEVNYTIHITLDDNAHFLRGFESIQYINNSSEQLAYIYFHLWPNAYKNNNTALAKQLLENKDLDFYYADASERGYIDSLQFLVNNDTVKWEYDSVHIDICKIWLNKLLNPGDTIIITTPFRVKIPSGKFSRLGHIGQSYQITQWYPKPAVYDNTGWHPIPYLNQGEFYSEFGSFDVSITLPENYVVAATGDFHPDSHKEEKWLENLAKENKYKLQENKFYFEEKAANNDFPPSSAKFKTIRYKQNKVHDFAWFADKRFNVLKDEYRFEKSGRIVTLWAMFTNQQAKYWQYATQYLNDAIHYYSLWNGEYPYNQVTAVDGTISAGGGMEYPNVTIIGEVNSDFSLEAVIVHEVGHNWFYGILGTNERTHPWMDEGINSFNEMRYIKTKYPKLSLGQTFLPKNPGLSAFTGLDKFKQQAQYYFSYMLNASRGFDQPINLSADEYTATNYGAIVYSKTALAFDYLKAYLGEKTFDKCMQTYYNTWKFKHPQPHDLKNIFQQVSGKDLRWFFDDYLKSNDVIDYKIKRKKRVDRRSSKTYMWMKYEESLVVKNKTDYIMPFCIQGIRADTVAAEVWYQGFKGKKTVNFPNGPYEYFKIDFREEIPEVNRQNNMLRDSGSVFKTTEKLRFKFLGAPTHPHRTSVFYSPVIGYNNYDGLMAGLVVYNNVFPQKNFEWRVMPMYGFRSSMPAGSAYFNWNINTRKSSWLNNIYISLPLRSYSTSLFSLGEINIKENFIKAAPEVTLRLRKKNARDVHNHFFMARSVFIAENSFAINSGNTELSYRDTLIFNIYNELKYSYYNTKTLTPYTFNFIVQQHVDFLRLSAEYTISKIYNSKGNKIWGRAFAGVFAYNNTYSSRYNWRMDGQSGYHDYTYDAVFISRNDRDALFGNQFIDNHGAMKAPTANGQSNSWLIAINLKADLPIPIIKPFIDIGMSSTTLNKNFIDRNKLPCLYSIGLYYPIIKNVADVYLPLLFSNAIQQEYDANGYKFGYRIRFTFHIDNLNPFKFLKTIAH